MVQLNLPALRSFLWGPKVNQALEDLNAAKTEAADVQEIAETVAEDKFNEVVAAPNDAVVEALVQDSGSATAAALNFTFASRPIVSPAVARAAREGRLIDTSESTTGWVLTTPVGTGSLTVGTDQDGWTRLSLTTLTAGTSARYGKEIAVSIPAGGGLAIPIKRDQNLSSIEIELVIGPRPLGDGSTRTVVAAMSVANHAPVGERYLLVVPLSQFNAPGATLEDFSRGTLLRIRAVPVAGENTVLEFGEIRVVGGSDPVGRVIWQFDDGREDTYSKAYPILNTRGYVGSVAVEYAQVGSAGRCTLPQLQELYASGWEFLGHHHLQVPPLGASGAATVFKAYRDWAFNNGFMRGVSHWVWPGGVRDVATDAIRKRFYATARGVSSQANVVVPQVFDPYDVSVVYVGSAGAVSTYTAWLDKVKLYGGTVILVFHSLTDGDPIAPEDYRVDRFTEIVDHAISLGIAGSSYDEALGTISPA